MNPVKQLTANSTEKIKRSIATREVRNVEQIFELMIAKECRQEPGAFWICIKSETAPKETIGNSPWT